MLPTSTLAALLLFGSVSLSYGAYKLLGLLFPAANLIVAAGSVADHDKREGLVDGEKSYALLGKSVTELSVLLLVTWLCENKPLFLQGGKYHDMDFFLFIIFVSFLCAFLFTVHKAPKDQGILNRDQTEEWRGFMQMVFLLYHYFAMEEVYPLIRLFISCYVFLTGFGNTSFFYLKRDYSLVRLLSMLWRLCFSCLCLAMVHNNPIILYYIVPLHTFYFLMAYCTMAILERRVNYTKYGLKIKLVLLGALIFLIWEFPQLFEMAFFFLSTTPHPGAPVGAYGTQYEWQFRSGLDHYSAFFGMVFACTFPMLEYRDLHVVSKSIPIRAVLSVVFFIAGLGWGVLLYPLPKFTYNSKHAYTFVFPMIAYLFLRNVSSYLRRVHLGMFAFAGKYTLETYLLQHHVWLTSNAKTLLVLVPGYPKMNFLVVSVFYFLLSVKLYDLTVKLKALLIPSNNSPQAKVNLTILGGVVGLCFCLAKAVESTASGWVLTTGGLVLLLASLWLFASYLIVRKPLSSSVVMGMVVLILTGFMVAGGAVSYFLLQDGDVANLNRCNANEGYWVKPFSLACKEAPQSNFAYCHSSGWTWGVSNQKVCGWKRVSTLKGGIDKIVLVGGDDDGLAQAFARIDQPKLAYKRPDDDDKVNMIDVAGNGKILFALKFASVNDLQSSLLVCQTKETYKTCEAAAAQGTAAHVVAIWNEPYASTIENNAVFVVNGYAVKSTASAVEVLDKDFYGDAVYDVLAQISLNQVLLKIKLATKPGGSADKPAPGGLAHDPVWGMVFLTIAFAALFLGDGYIGLVAIVTRLFGHEFIPWDVPYDAVHAKIPDIGLSAEKSTDIAITAKRPPVAKDPEHLSDADGEEVKLMVPPKE